MVTDETECAGNVVVTFLCHDQQKPVGHGLSDMREEFLCKVGRAPAHEIGALVKEVELFPVCVGDGDAGQDVEADAGLQHLLAFLAHVLALARAEAGCEIVEAGITSVEPLVLTTHPLLDAELPEGIALALVGKQHMPA